MGIKKTGEVTGASIILLIFFPILIAKLMANKYHKDGFLGMIKATLAGILILSTLLVYNFSSLNGWNKIADNHKYEIESAERYINNWTEIVNDDKKLKSYVDDFNKNYKTSAMTLKEQKASFLESIKEYEEILAKETAKQNKLFLEMATAIISIIIMLLASIILFISSSKRSRILARAEMETTTNENHRRTEP